MPFGITIGNARQQFFRHADIAHIDCVAHLYIHAGIGAGIAGGIPIESAIGSAGICAAGTALLRIRAAGSAILPLLHDRVIRVIDFLHFLFRKICQRIVDVVVRMILSRQISVGALDLIF